MNTLIFIVNIFDTIGRYLPNYISFGKKSFLFFVYIRIIFLITYPLAIYFEYKQIWGVRIYFKQNTFVGVFTIINLVFFSIINGIDVSLAFILGISAVKDEYKANAGSSLSFFLNVGIFSGSAFAMLVMKKLIELIKQ